MKPYKHSYLRKTKLVCNCLILLVSFGFIFYGFFIIYLFFEKEPFIYTKYWISERDKIILNSVHIIDDSPIKLYDVDDNYHSVYSIYQHDQLLYTGRYPTSEEQAAIDLIMEPHDKIVNILLNVLGICFAIRLIIAFKIIGHKRKASLSTIEEPAID